MKQQDQKEKESLRKREKFIPRVTEELSIGCNGNLCEIPSQIRGKKFRKLRYVGYHTPPRRTCVSPSGRSKRKEKRAEDCFRNVQRGKKEKPVKFFGIDPPFSLAARVSRGIGVVSTRAYVKGGGEKEKKKGRVEGCLRRFSTRLKRRGVINYPPKSCNDPAET